MFTKEITTALKYDPANEAGYVAIGALRTITGRQTQYLARYFGAYGVSDLILDEGLRTIIPESMNYHGILIHESDLEEFLVRYHAQVIPLF